MHLASLLHVGCPPARIGGGIVLVLTLAGCSDKTLLEPEIEQLTAVLHDSCETEIIPSEECGGDDGGGYDTSYNYGSYTHYGESATDPDVNGYQADAYTEDQDAFAEYAYAWDDAEAVAAWPAAVAAVRAGASGARYAARVGARLARTSRIRDGVRSGARWARDVSVAVAAIALAGRWPVAFAYEQPDDIPISEFDFMFDYAEQ